VYIALNKSTDSVVQHAILNLSQSTRWGTVYQTFFKDIKKSAKLQLTRPVKSNWAFPCGGRVLSFICGQCYLLGCPCLS